MHYCGCKGTTKLQLLQRVFLRMLTKEQIIREIKHFCGNGTVLDNGWYHFVYRHLHYLYIPNSNEMIRITIPYIGKNNEYDKEWLETVINETNREVKYVKVVVLDNGSISINYDHKINERENASEIVPHIVEILYDYCYLFHF